MQVISETVYRGTEILNRPNGWEGVPLTVDFTSVSDTIDGRKVVKAGTPLSREGKKVSDDSVWGILLSDVFEARPIGTVLKKGYLNKKRINEHAGEDIPAAVLEALPMIVVE